MEMPFQKEMPYRIYVKKLKPLFGEKYKLKLQFWKYNIGMENYVRIYAKMKKPQEGKINFLGRTKILIQHCFYISENYLKRKTTKSEKYS